MIGTIVLVVLAVVLLAAGNREIVKTTEEAQGNSPRYLATALGMFAVLSLGALVFLFVFSLLEVGGV